MLAQGRRRSEILTAARNLIERGGPDALTMRALGEAVGMRAPSLYKHFPDKDAVEHALAEEGLREFVGALETALAAFAEPMPSFAAAYRKWAIAHPHLYRLVIAPRCDSQRSARVERSMSLAQPLLNAAGGDAANARVLWGLCHGLALLEITGHFPRPAAADVAWASGVAALSRASTTFDRSADGTETVVRAEDFK